MVSDHPMTHMERECREAPGAVGRMLAANTDSCKDLARFLSRSPPPFVVTCARGSSDHAATYAKYLFETQCGVITASFAPSISSVYNADVALNGALFLAISQSGKSPDLLAGAEHARGAGAFVLAMCNVDDAPLAEIADVCLPLHAGPEISVAATKSFIAAMASILQVTAHWSGRKEVMASLDHLPRQLGEAAALDWSSAVDAFAAARDMYVSARGYGFGIAQEAALKLKETSGLHAEPFSSAEILHGPLELMRGGFPVLVFAQDDETRASTDDLVNAIESKGGLAYVAATGRDHARALPVVGGCHPLAQPITMIQSFYPLANAVSHARGRNPDQPRHLHKVTETV